MFAHRAYIFSIQLALLLDIMPSMLQIIKCCTITYNVHRFLL